MRSTSLAIRTGAFGLALILGLAAGVSAQRQQPPEYKEVVAASRIKDAAARLKEFERIKAAYPQSPMAASIDNFIIDARIELAPTLDAVLEIQKNVVGQGAGPRLVSGYLQGASQILEHPKVKSFDSAKVLEIVLRYKDGGAKAAAEPATLAALQDKEQQKAFAEYYRNAFELASAQAYLNAGQAAKALTILDAYRVAGGAADGGYLFARGEACDRLGRSKDAFDAYLGAAVEKYEGAADKARALYVKLNGKADGFETVFEAKRKELPYHPEPFKAPADWKGKVVLAEAFTGSECPPCVGADLGFDGLIEAYPSQYLAVLEYHLPIPRPDPIMNAATQKRQAYYGVNSTPSTFFDGEAKAGGGGSRGMSEGKFKAYKAEIDGRIGAALELLIKAKASRAGDAVKVECEFDRSVPGAEVYAALVQNVEKYAGSNGIVEHKMVVRDLAVLAEGSKTAAFDLAASEKAADEYLTNFENTSTRFKGYKFPERHARIDRSALRIVVFVQMKETKKVLNAVVAEVQ